MDDTKNTLTYRRVPQVFLKLNHANVLKFVEFINDSNQLLMIFEYIPDNVKRVMKRRYVV
ncbi:hypothetical protein DPMN_176989 [Dreissena polymorpha]|uniref:Protein kinase domain-containing protein n=1 Tax=Dreissena polymorpha TaxID=45954 RepID=A0A9D4E7X8_DREPO|nr:hypothetical protein DPMN_176989 [Dreissena polymorpha]